MNLNLMRRLVGGFLLMLATASHAELIRDYYEEPGLHPFKETVNQGYNESIDPFGGVLQIKHTDIVIPGNGGLDININRVYTSKSSETAWEPVGISGLGWAMHFGRIVVPMVDKDKICIQNMYSVTTLDNPSLEHADGGRELLMLRMDSVNGLITKSNWKMDCDGEQTKIVTAPNGTVYRMDVQEIMGDGNEHWLPSIITDVHGNTLTFTYAVQGTSGNLGITKIIASDGRVVTYEYLNEHISAINANGQRFEYRYQPVLGVAGNYQYLTEVLRPDGLSWSYAFNPMYTDGTPGSFNMNRVTYPYGATADYTYQTVYFANNGVYPNVAIRTKITGGREVTPGTWTYTFAPGSTLGTIPDAYLDRTTIDTPVGQEIYLHYGVLFFWNQTGNGDGGHWAIGLLYEHRVLDGGNLVERNTRNWGSRKISNENYSHNGDTFDIGTYAPQLNEVATERDGIGAVTSYSVFDAYGNPTVIERSSSVAGVPNKITALTYFNNAALWIIGLVKDETTEGKTIGRAYNGTGQVESELRYGVETVFTYTLQGDLATIRDARNNTVIYSDYYRGIPQREQHPEGKLIVRVVNDTGTVASETNGRSITTGFGYDDLNRLASITYPSGNPVSVGYVPTGKRLTRGSYIETITVDGFGNPISIVRTGGSAPPNITLRYDALNRKVFQSYPGSIDGDTFELDAVGRTKRLSHADGTGLSYTYSGLHSQDVKDENNHITKYLSLGFGVDEQGYVVEILSNESNILTKIERNLLNQPTHVFQGESNGGGYTGYARDYTYDTRFYLTNLTGPDLAETVFGRDGLGNMTSKQVGTEAAATYVYDGLNQLKQVNYPTGTPSVTTSYDGNGNVSSISNGIASMSYQYDPNDNATLETITIGTTVYTVGYTIDGNDFVSHVRYPSGRSVQLGPDAFGRATTAAPYVTSVGYHPTGQIQSMTFANGQTTAITLDARMRLKTLRAGGVTSVSDLTYGYDDVGNILGISDAIDPGRTRTLTYDAMNRLKTAAGAFGNIGFEYNGLGDILSKTVNGVTAQYVVGGLMLGGVTTPDNTRAYTYDGYGNVSRIIHRYLPLGLTVEDSTYIYNDAAQLVEAHKMEFGQPTINKTFDYDGNNMRVRSVSDGTERRYVYSRTGLLLGEYSGDVLYGKEHIYVGNQLVATATNNMPPVANAGTDGQVAVGGTALLNGGSSTDADGQIAGYLWQQISGPTGVLSNANTVTASYVAPAGSVGQIATFLLTVTDDSGETGTDTVAMTITDPPVANAGLDQTVLAESLVTLDGSGSGGGAGALSFEWTPINNTIVLTNPNTATPTFTAPTVSTHTSYSFSLRVTDTSGLSTTDTVSVQVLSLTYDSDGDKLPDAWEFTHFGSWTLYNGASDPDGDGIPNSQEYAEGTDPTVVASAPTQVQSVTGRAGVGINLVEWTPVDSVLSYKLYWSTTPNFDLAGAQVISNVKSPVFHEKLTNGTTYYYAVVGSNNAGDSPKSPERALLPQAGVWQAPVAQSGSVMAANARGAKAVFWVSYDGSLYRLKAQRYQPASGWDTVREISTSTNSIDEKKLRVAMNTHGDILAVWKQNDTSVDLKGVSYSAASGAWSIVQVIDTLTQAVSDVGDLVLNDSKGAVAWTQDGNIWAYGKVFTTATMSWSGAYLLNPSDSGCFDATYANVDINSGGNAVFAWYSCMEWRARGVRNGVLLPTHMLASTTQPNIVPLDLDVNEQDHASITARNSENGVMYGWDFDIGTDTVSAAQTVRSPKSKVISVVYTHLGEDGNKYYAWYEEGTLYSLVRSTSGDVLKTVATAARGYAFEEVQSLMGRDQAQVIAWRATADGGVYVARYNAATQAWVPQLLNSGSPAARQCTAIDGMGYSDTLWGGTGSLSSYAAAP